MKRLLIGGLLLAITVAVASDAFGWGVDFTKDEIAAVGKHCVHGFWVNEQSVTYFAGDAAQLNRDFPKYLEREYTSRKVILHVGTKRAESPWDTKPRDTFADWSVNTWDDPADAAKATPHWLLQIDIWLGSTIKLEDLRIPQEFEVISGAEIDNFIRQRSPQTKLSPIKNP